MNQVYAIHIDHHLDQYIFAKLQEYISSEKKEYISRFYKYEDAQRSLLGDILARYCICTQFNMKNEELVFRNNEYGKPMVMSNDNIHFNISHSGNFIVCIADNHPVGIDVEEIILINNIESILDSFSEEEINILMSQSKEKRLNLFYVIWTLKESYVKAQGQGLSIPLNSFSVVSDIFLTPQKGININEYSLFHDFLCGKAIYSVCTLNPKPPSIMVLSIDDFLLKCLKTL